MSAQVVDTTKKPSRKMRIQAEADPAPTPVKRRRILLVCSPKGGSTKTSTCRSVAVAAAQAGLKVATLDLDRQRTLTKWWAARPDEGVVQFDHHEGNMGDLDSVFAELDEDYDLVVIDTPPGIEDHPVAVKRLVTLADLVLVPTGQHKDDRDSVVRWMEFLKSYGKPAAFLLGRAKKRTRVLDVARAHLNKSGRLCPIVVYDTEDIPAAFEAGLTVLDINGARGAEEVEGVWHYVKNEMGI
jgi:chromosome partitioning protein